MPNERLRSSVHRGTHWTPLVCDRRGEFLRDRDLVGQFWFQPQK